MEAPSAKDLPKPAMSAMSWLFKGEEEKERQAAGADGSASSTAAAAARSSAPPGLFMDRPDVPPVPDQQHKANASSSSSRPPAPPVPQTDISSLAASWLSNELGNGAQANPQASPRQDEEPTAPENEYEKRKEDFATYLSEDEWQRGLQNGTLIKGVIRMSRSQRGNAYVKPDGVRDQTKDLLVRGKLARNRSVEGDIVVVRLLTEAEADAESGGGRKGKGKGKRKGKKGKGKGKGYATGAEEEAFETIEEGDDDEDSDEGADIDDPLRPQRGDLIAESDASDSEEETVFFAQKPRNGATEHAEGEAANGSTSRTESGAAAVQGETPYGDRRMAEVVAIAVPKGTTRTIVCTLHPNRDPKEKKDEGKVLASDKFIKAIPTDQRMPWILIQVNDVTRKILKIPGKLDKFMLWPVKMTVWKEQSSLPLGRIHGKMLGQAGDIEAEERHALIEHGLDTHDEDFTEDLLEEVDNVVCNAGRTFEDECKIRNDLRKKRIFTIDPATARDLDDAIHVDRDDAKQEIEVGVHIADVGHFLKLSSIADTEAQRRTTSVYLLGRVLPMLPHALCNHLCSLNPNDPKLAFSAFFRLCMNTGNLVQDPKPWFQKTAISSVCRLNYDEVQEMLDGKEIDPPPVYGGYTWQEIQDDIKLLRNVCGKVRRGRFTGGALAISKMKMIFHTRDSEDGIPTDYHLEEHSASHWIIEELMLLANRCVATHLAKSPFSEISVLRNHEQPDSQKAEKLEKLMKENLGMRWQAADAGQLYRTLQAVRKKCGEMLGLCVEMMTMRSGMKQATYFVYDNEEEVNPRHFALNFDYYTHFTSPIRRYPDVMVHRALQATLTGDSAGAQERTEAEDQVMTCNEKRTACRKCSYQLDRAIFCVYLRSQKQWFYTVGTVLELIEASNEERRGDSLNIYCSQLGKDTKAALVNDTEMENLGLFDNGVDDKLMLPTNWKFQSRGHVEVYWTSPTGEKYTQSLRMLTCLPIVIIPTNTVPIDYKLFFVSPFHPMFDEVNADIPEKARRGFDWIEGADSDGIEVVHDARAPRGEQPQAPGEGEDDLDDDAMLRLTSARD